MSDFAEREWLSRDGLRLYSRDYPGASGDARLPLVCLHGFTRNSKDFEDVAPRVAVTGRRVLVPDMRGRGRSERDPQPGRYQPKVYARDVLGLMDALGISRAVFVGTSMGGLITMTIAALRRKAIAGAILNDVGPEIGMAGIERILSYAGKAAPVETWADAVDYVRMTTGVAFPGNSDDDWSVFARRTFRDEGGKPVLDYDPAIIVPTGNSPPKTRSLIASLLFRRLANGCPTLLIRGELSDLMTAEIAARMKRSVPSLQVAAVPGVGHAPVLTEAAAVQAIDEFLARVP